MKKKVALLLTIAALCITMTGCTFELPFKKDKVEDAGDVSSTDAEGSISTGIEVMNGVTFTVGSEVSIYDLVMIPEEMGTPVMAALIDTDGMVYETITADTVGDFTYEIAIDFEDGNSFGDVVSFSVTDGSASTDSNGFTEEAPEPVQVVEIPAELSYSIDNHDWSSFFIPTTNVEDDEMTLIDSSVIISGDNTMVSFTQPYGIIPMSNIVMDSGSSDYIISIGYVDYGLESRLSELNLSPVRSANTSLKAAVDMAGLDSQIHDWYYQAIDAMTSIRTGDTGYKMYDSNGNEYPINVVIAETDWSKIGLADYDKVNTALFYYVEYNNGYIVIRVPNSIIASESDEESEDTSEETGEEEASGDIGAAESYEDFCALLSPKDDVLSLVVRSNTDDANRYISELCNCLLIGDYSVLKSSEPVDEEGSVDIDGTPTGEDVEDELNGAAGKVITYYIDKYPELYSYWPQKNNVYRRWVYNISEDTSYVGSIIPRDADGVIQIGGATVTIPDNYDDAPDVSDGDDEYGNNQSDSSQTFTLSSSYNTYEISNGGKSNMTFNTSQSTSGRLALQYNGTRYYIETVRVSQINNYISECLYSTSTFKDNSFTVVDGGNSINTDLGTITQYVIRYEDTNGNQQELPYMAVYNIDNDYLCVYADALPTTSSNVFAEMLRDMVKLK